MSAALLTLTTHVQIGSLCVERHLFADIKLGTIDVLQTEVELVICRPLTDQEIIDVCSAQDTPKGRKQSYSGVLMSASRAMFALQKASLNSEFQNLQEIMRVLRECVLKLSRKIETCHRSRTKFAHVLRKHLENRAIRVILQTLLHQPDDAWASRVWEQIAVQAQEEQVRDLLWNCLLVLHNQSEDLRQQLLLTRNDADN